MKNVIVLIIISMLVFSCKKNNDPGNPDNPGGNQGIVIKGKIALTAGVNINNLKSGNSLSLSDAKKVLIYSGSRYTLADIVNGSFSASAESGSATALVFLDANNKYIGNLFAGGLYVLPLDSLKNGKNTTIDLTTLTLSGTSVIPAHNPLGDEIVITADEINCLKEVSGYYESLSKNIDADNDGVPDVLSKKQIDVYTMFAICVGKWGINATLPALRNINNCYINYTLHFIGGSGIDVSGNSFALSGPAGAPYSDIELHGFNISDSFMATFKRVTPAPMDAPWGSTFLPFKGGTYTLTINGNKSYTLNYSNIGVKANLLLVIPTIHTNSDGKMTSISLDYRLPNGNKVNPSTILTDVSMQLFNINRGYVYDGS
ncbi:MAG TPA: hypothetical protein VGK38_12045, partial [Prolixibacteraceae bacterium]